MDTGSDGWPLLHFSSYLSPRLTSGFASLRPRTHSEQTLSLTSARFEPKPMRLHASFINHLVFIIWRSPYSLHGMTDVVFGLHFPTPLTEGVPEGVFCSGCISLGHICSHMTTRHSTTRGLRKLVVTLSVRMCLPNFANALLAIYSPLLNLNVSKTLSTGYQSFYHW